MPQFTSAPGPYGAQATHGYGGYPPMARKTTAKPTDLGIAACGLALFGFSFAPMLSTDLFSDLLNGWHDGLRSYLLLALLGAALAIVFLLKAFELTPIPDRLLSFKLDQLATVVGLLGVIVSLGTMIGSGAYSIGWGAIITLLVSCGLIALGIVNLKASGDL